MITDSEIEPYLRERGLLDSAEDAPAQSIERIAGRNLIHKVTGPSGGYIVKQGFGPEGSVAIAGEAAAYRHLAKRRDRRLDRHLARFIDHDVERDALILELVGNAQSLRDYHVGRGYFSLTLARALGDALGALHGPPPASDELPARFPTAPPWILSLHRPDLNMLGHASTANIEMIKTVQQVPDLGKHLDRLRHAWEPTRLIHSDVRWDNCVVSGRPGSHRQTRLELVDLELVQLGDPLWDVGCAMGDYLSLWVLSIPMTGETQPDHFARLSRYPIERMQPAIRALWHTYIRSRGLTPAAAARALERTVEYCAARVLQTGFERNQLSGYLTGAVMCLLQLSLNTFDQRAEATVELLGLTDETGAVT